MLQLTTDDGGGICLNQLPGWGFAEGMLGVELAVLFLCVMVMGAFTLGVMGGSHLVSVLFALNFLSKETQ